jgi:hypothetical protein
VWATYALAGTHFDLDLILLLDKYAMHPLTNGLREKAQLQRLRAWAVAWIDARRKPR